MMHGCEPPLSTGSQCVIVLGAQWSMKEGVAEAGMARNARAKIVIVKIAAKDLAVLILARCHPVACLVYDEAAALCSGAIKSFYLKMW